MADLKKYLGEIGLNKLVERIKAYDAASLTIAKEYTDEKFTENKITVDSAISGTSTNPVQNQALKSKFDSVESAIAGKAASSHTHDDRYYTEDEVDEKISGITSGTIIVKEAEHAESADTATSATTATTATNANHATTADSATSADSATTADSATKDGSGNVIASTYETKSDADATEEALTELINGKADSSHTHAISEVTNLQSTLDSKVPTSRTVNGKALTSNITLSASDVSAYSKTEIDSKVSTINSAISGKEASGTAASAVSAHNTNTSAHNDIRALIEDLTERLNALANSTDEDLDQMAEIVEYIKANKTLIDSITTSKVNVADIVNNLTTNVANKPLSAAQGVAIKSLIDTLQAEVDADEKSLADHVANKSNPHGVTLSQLGVTATAAELNIMDGVTATASEINKLDGVTATTAELNYVDGVTSNIQTQLDAKQATITGGATTIASSNLTASRALVSNSSGKVAVSAVTSTELGYLDGVTSAIQSQLDSKSASDHTHNYAGSSSAGGVANSAAKLETARNINLTGDVAGSVSFDGSADASISTTVSSMHGIKTAGTGAAYTATVDGITALTAGVSFIMIPHTNSTTTTPTLNVNSLGAKGIRMRGSSATGTAMAAAIAAWLAANRPVQLTYNGIYWVAEVTRPAATDLSGTVPIANGGTGATTAAAAVTNLGGLSVVVSSTEPTNTNAAIWIQTS